MTTCPVQASGSVELYFYDELEARERADVDRHLSSCAECRRALEELRVIRDALASRPDVSAPPAGDWTAFMTRLDSALERERPRSGVLPFTPRRSFVAYVAMAALLALVTISVAVAMRSVRPRPAPMAAPQPEVALDATADFATLSEEHFERSKLVVLGLATKDPADRRTDDWAYERELASSLLNDTRMYRLAAEDRGLSDIAGIMRDLEIVLLQTSLTDEKDPSSLPRIQRLIQRRDLLEKMDAVAAASSVRPQGTKGI